MNWQVTVKPIRVQDDKGHSTNGNTECEPEGGPLCLDDPQFSLLTAWCFLKPRLIASVFADLFGAAPDLQRPDVIYRCSCQESQMYQQGRAEKSHRPLSEEILGQDEYVQNPYAATGHALVRTSGERNVR